MNKKKLIILAIIFILVSVFSFYYALKPSKIVIDLSDPAYSYLPESAKNFITNEAKKGHKILTEKNKEPNKVYLNPKYVEYLNLTEEEKNKVEVIPQTYTYDYISLKNASGTYPSYYKLSDLVVKNQYSLGICWAFATVSSVETNILKTGLSSNSVRFSERQLDYAMANKITEINNPYSAAAISETLDTFYEVKNHELGTGSNFIEAYMYFNMGISPVKEEIWGEYDTSNKTRSINEVLNYDNVEYSVSSYASYGDNIYNKTGYSTSFKEQFMNKLKRHITNYGSLYIVTISPDSDAGACFDQTKSLLTYDDNNENCNNGTFHAMSIVGWDDNYEGGAWILKNSWGNNLPYLYLSYNSDFYDINGVIRVDAKNWDNGYNFTNANTSSYTYNSYEVKYYKSSEFNENLEKINFVSWGINATYNIYYKNGESSYKLLGSVTTEAPGLVTYDVSNVVLDKSSFSIKVTAADEGGFIDSGLNAFTSNVTNEKYSETYQFTNPGNTLSKELIVRNMESGTKVNYYIYDEYGKKYNNDDYAYIVNGTVDIDHTLGSLPSGKYYLTLDDKLFNVSTNDKVELKVGNTHQIEYEAGSNLTIRTLSYIIDDSTIVSVDETGLMTALKAGKTIVTLNINDNILVPIEVTTFKDSNIESLKILDDNQTIYMSVTNEFNIHLDITPSTYTAEDLTWISSNNSIATVENGLVRFLSSGEVKITTSSGVLTDEITFNVTNSTSNVQLYADKTTIAVNEEIRLTHSEVEPGYRYSTSDNEVLKVRNGNVTGLKNGSAWVYYKKGNDVAGILINVVDENEKVNLTINPNGGVYEESKEIQNIQGSSLSTTTLSVPSYDVVITLVNGEESQEVNISHEFDKFNLLGYGALNDNIYTFGFGNGTLTALWNYSNYTLPVLEKEGMNFAGWYKDSEFTDYLGKNISIVPEENMTLYAKFEEGKTGDINGDNEIDITDLVILRKYLAGLEELTEKESLFADINHDGSVDITDLVILRKYLAGLEEIQ